MLERKMKPHQGNSPLHILGRYALYTVLIIAVFLPLPVVVTASGIGAYGEGGFIEWCPFILLATSLSIFLIGFYLQPEERGAFALLAVLVCLALVRKNDACLDSMISIGGWKTLAALVATVGFLVVFHERSSIRQGTVTIISGHSFPLLWCGFVAVVPFSQIMGRAKLIKALLGIEYLRNYKTLVHESTELLGYLLIVIGAIEMFRETSHGKYLGGLVQSVSAEATHGERIGYR
ncbi:MAG TPA: hypothetical protein PK596_06985 [Bacteroidales bacterium]|nr:hypothetical protein [Bacteroidales bacterium]